MDVEMEILDEEGEVIEEHTAPEGSWIQTDKAGSQHLPAVLDEEYFDPNIEGVSKIVFEPQQTVDVPQEIKNLLNSGNDKWGKNGYEWMGKNCAKQGGTLLDRVRELFTFYEPHEIPTHLPVDLPTSKLRNFEDKLDEVL